MSHSAHLLIPAPPRSAEEVTREFLQQLVPKDCTVTDDGTYLIVRRGIRGDFPQDISVIISPEEHFQTVCGIPYAEEIFFENVWADDEITNTDILLEITLHYMELHPDALFYDSCSRDRFRDYEDIRAIAAMPFDREWIGSTRSHLRLKPVDRYSNEWIGG